MGFRDVFVVRCSVGRLWHRSPRTQISCLCFWHKIYLLSDTLIQIMSNFQCREEQTVFFLCVFPVIFLCITATLSQSEKKQCDILKKKKHFIYVIIVSYIYIYIISSPTFYSICNGDRMRTSFLACFLLPSLSPSPLPSFLLSLPLPQNRKHQHLGIFQHRQIQVMNSRQSPLPSSVLFADLSELIAHFLQW